MAILKIFLIAFAMCYCFLSDVEFIVFSHELNVQFIQISFLFAKHIIYFRDYLFNLTMVINEGDFYTVLGKPPVIHDGDRTADLERIGSSVQV